jgi:hypothetical protein
MPAMEQDLSCRKGRARRTKMKHQLEAGRAQLNPIKMMKMIRGTFLPDALLNEHAVKFQPTMCFSDLD